MTNALQWNHSESRDFREKQIVFSRFLTPYMVPHAKECSVRSACFREAMIKMRPLSLNCTPSHPQFIYFFHFIISIICKNSELLLYGHEESGMTWGNKGIRSTKVKVEWILQYKYLKFILCNYSVRRYSHWAKFEYLYYDFIINFGRHSKATTF